ncbi:MAG: PD-(D/E)XK nuclease family protein [Cyclobacteriaceae bacterium]|nr:PD-(D/E)XK nuclease family protein [Cyclobacteriaceae bacterium]
MSEVITKPVFAPRLITIEDFIASFSLYQVPDKLELVHRLHSIYSEVIGSHRESFDQFYFWGEMLLRDFNEIDKYLVNAEQLFRDLRNQKELDSSFDYLTEAQKKFLLDFWNEFNENITDNKKQFIDMWSKLFALYKTYRQHLQQQQLAYEGMVHREVAENIGTLAAKEYPAHLRFVGFNALTKAEERILCYFVDKGSRMIWDGDEYYVNNKAQEAGEFFREYQQHEILKQTFQQNFPSNFRNPKSIKVLGAAQPIGQAKLLGQILQEELEKGLVPEDTLIVLPDEKLLMPVLYGLPKSVDKLNVTMGYALGNTSFFNLLELLVELQIGKRKDYYNHRQVLALLVHPYIIAADPGLANTRRREIQKSNWVQIPQNYLASALPLHRLVFGDMADGLLPYLQSVLREIGSLEFVQDLDREFAFQFIKLLNRVQDIIGTQTPDVADRKEFVKSLKSFLRLLRQLARAEKIPFSGEPLKGLQIMGVLETRNLDYKNVFVLSLNEGAFPSFGGKGSYVPFNIRKAYALPTTEHQDAMYAYLFYRMLQRAENVFLFYNTETDQLGQGEKSRYLQQLIFESGLKMESQVLHNPLMPMAVEPIVITKTAEVQQAIMKLNEGNTYFKGISPSALASYLDCRLRFYFRYVAGIKEPKEVEDELGARELGNFLHKVMEKFYKNLAQRKQNKRVEAGDFADAGQAIDKLMDEVFTATYNMEPGKKVEYEGQSVIIQQLVQNFAARILDHDREMVPFIMEAVEQDGLLHRVKISHAPGYAVLGGKIDRVDRKDNVLRIVDYKTGSDKLDFESVASLFDRNDKKRQKAVFQTLLYAFLYQTNFPLKADDQVITGIMNRELLFGNTTFGLTIGKRPVQNVVPLMEEFSLHLTALLEEIFNPEVPFDQTQDPATCRFCPYKSICYRD